MDEAEASTVVMDDAPAGMSAAPVGLKIEMPVSMLVLVMVTC
jgi:hypothetical protein